MSNNSSDANAAACLALIREARVMTLGTADRETKGPWTAPVYYLFRAGQFYFFSNPKSRHIRHLRFGTQPLCAASIFADSPRIDGLQGIQMSGKLAACKGAAEAVKTAVAYAAKYGIAVKGKNPIDYFVSVFHASLYAFLPEDIYFMNNSTGFGHRAPVRL